MKKLIQSFLLIPVLFIAQVINTFALDKQNDNENFADLSVIKTWLADIYHDDEDLIAKIAAAVKLFMYPSPYNSTVTQALMKKIRCNPNTVVREYYTVPTIAAVELPFLQQVKKVSKNKKNIITLEIAAARGYVSWKVPVAFANGGVHYANDINSNVIEIEMKKNLYEIYHNIGKPELIEHIRPVVGSCFSLLSLHPELKNNVDVIYVQRLEHFFNPKQHQEFLTLIETLLAPGGYAFLCAHNDSMVKKSKDIKEDYHKLFAKAEADAIDYPAFIQYSQESKYNLTTDKFQIKQYNVCRPENDSECFHGPINYTKQDNIETTIYRSISNYFTPEIYRQAIIKNTNLEIVDSFIIDNKNSYEIPAIAAIIVKKGNNSIKTEL